MYGDYLFISMRSSDIRRAKARAVGGKKDRCRKGKSCSATCISGWKACLVEMSDSVSASLTKTGKAIGKRAEQVLPGLKGRYLERRKNEYLAVRKRLEAELERAYLRRNKGRMESLKKRFDALEESVGKKLGLPKATLDLSPERKSSLDERKKRYIRALEKLLDKVDEAAAQGKKGTYDKLEKRLMDAEAKGGKKFGPILGPTLAKGEIWAERSKSRRLKRQRALLEAHGKLINELEKAAREGDRARYLKIEKAVLKVQSRTGSKIDVLDEVKRGEVWGRERLGKAKERVMNDAIRAISSGDRDKYDKAIERAIRIGTRFKDEDLKNLRSRDMWNSYQGLAHLLTRLDKSDLKNVREGTKNFRIEHFSRGGWQEINVKSQIRGNNIVINVSPNSYSFTVNGSYLASSNLPRADKVAIVREVRRQFEEITKNMGEGTAMSVTASEGDSRTEMRQRGYGDFGFSGPDRRGQMFGKVKNGKMTPIDEDEYDEDVKYSFSKA